MSEIVITQAGLDRALEELEHLKTTGREAMAERIRQAVSTDANVSENLEYLGAREDQAALEHRIAHLEERLAGARVVDPDAANGVVDVGERVGLRDVATGERLEVELVGPLEVDTGRKRISTDSPLGRALLGRRKGEIAVVDAPKGELRFKILRIETPEAARADDRADSAGAERKGVGS